MALSATTPPATQPPTPERLIEFPDNRVLIDLCGEYDRNLAQIEHQLGVQILRRGNQLAVFGDADAQVQAEGVLHALYQRVESEIGRAHV